MIPGFHDQSKLLTGTTGLKNPSMAFGESLNFGIFNNKFDPYLQSKNSLVKYQYWIDSGSKSIKDMSLNVEGARSVNINYPGKGPVAEEDASSLKTKSVNLNKKWYERGAYPSLPQNFPTPVPNPHGFDPNTLYSGKLNERLRDRKKLLSDRGLPDMSVNAYKDDKNLQDLAQIDNNANEYIDNDLINFYFEDVTTYRGKAAVLIAFRALISSFADSTTADWQTQTYVGRPDKFYIYGGFDRKINITFDIAINSSDEMIPSWRKLNYLQGMCYPVAYPGAVPMVAPIMKITIGNLLEGVYCVLNSINFNFDESTIWETTPGFQLPTYVRVSIDFNVLYDTIPIANANHFAQKQPWIATKDILKYNRAGNAVLKAKKSVEQDVNSDATEVTPDYSNLMIESDIY
jgi:hypothetical protein